MNILHILGNGFDINLGLDTRYSDFYKFYHNEKSNNKIIDELKKSISNGIEDWSDLELALGRHTEKLKNVQEFDEVIESIGAKLSEYLTGEEAKIKIDNIDESILKINLCYPEANLLKVDFDNLTLYRKKWENHTNYVNIISLNYTRTFEKIIPFKSGQTNLQIGNFGRSSILLLPPEHIHGFTDDRMVLGVNDLKQISNKRFHDEIDIREAFIKSECNRTLRHNIDNLCSTNITKANLICVFGSSIGETDKNLWQQIGVRMAESDCRLIIFKRGKKIPKRLAYKKARLERDAKNHFLSKIDLPDEIKRFIEGRIYIAINSNMFNITKQHPDD